jgi:hypothetical protein
MVVLCNDDKSVKETMVVGGDLMETSIVRGLLRFTVARGPWRDRPGPANEEFVLNIDDCRDKIPLARSTSCLRGATVQIAIVVCVVLCTRSLNEKVVTEGSASRYFLSHRL